MKYKRIALVLSLLMLLNVICPTIPISYGASLSPETLKKLQQLNAYQGDIFAKDLLLNSDISIDTIETYLTEYGEKLPLWSKDLQYRLNPYVYKKYKAVAYTNEEAYKKGIAGLTSLGSPLKETQTFNFSDGTSDKKIVDEYRYLGYKKNGIEIITNDFYPADQKSSTPMTQKKWVKNDPYVDSWNKKVRDNSNMLYYYLKTRVENDDLINNVFEQKDYSIADLAKSNDYETLTQFPKVMSDVSFSNPVLLNMVHRSGGKLWYDTMRLDQFSYELQTTIDNIATDVKLPVGTESYDISYEVTTAIKNLKTDGVSKSGKYFKSIAVDSVNTYDQFVNKENKDIDLPLLKNALTKTIDLKGMKPNVTKTVAIKATSIAKTFDEGIKTSYASKVVKITLVANDVVDFLIKKNETDITGANVTVNKLDFSVPLTLTLEDRSLVQSGTVTGRDWYVKKPTGWTHFKGGNDESVQYTINTVNKNVLMDGQVAFRLVVSTADGAVGNSEQFIIPVEKTSSNVGGDVVAVLTSTADFNENKDYYEVMEGEIFTLKGHKSYHKGDLKITDYDFDVGEDFNEGIKVGGSKKSIRAFYPNSDGGTVYKAYLEVTDKVGATDTDSVRTKVLPAEFNPQIDIFGTFKENRKLSFFVDNRHKLTYYPIDASSVRWTIIPLDGQGDVIRVDGSLNGRLSFDALFKKKGRYKVHVEGQIASPYNSKRYSGVAEKIITIAEDLKPVAKFAVPKTEVRDVRNGNVTMLYARDTGSESIDGDFIVQRIWSYKFDSNNDGSFDDETSVVIHAGNSKIAYLETDHVGHYQFELKVKEAFGQPSIGRFITDADKKRSNTDSKPLDEKITDLQNVAPTVDLEVSKRKEVNLIIYEDLDTTEKIALESKLTELEKGLLEKKINLNTHYLSPSEKIGYREVNPSYRESYIECVVNMRYWNENNDRRDRTKTYRFLLHSEKTSSMGEFTPQKGRFKIISSELEDSYKSGPHIKNKDGGYSGDYYYIEGYRNLNVTYKDTWEGVIKTKSYKVVTDIYIKYDNGSSTEFEHVYERLSSTELKEDQRITTTNSVYYIDPDASFEFNRHFNYERYLDLNRDLKPYKKDLKSYDKAVLEKMIKDMPINDDKFFINASQDSDHQLGFDKTLFNLLKENKVTYLSTNKGKTTVNPLTGRFDKVVHGEEVLVKNPYTNRVYDKAIVAKIGESAFELDRLSNTMFPSGNFNKLYRNNKLQKKAKGFTLIDPTVSYKGGGMVDKEKDYYNYWKGENDFIRDYLGGSFFRQYSSALYLSKDGNIKFKKFYSHDEGYMYWHYNTHASGFTHEIIIDDFETYYVPNRGYVHHNGKIYFKKIKWIGWASESPYKMAISDYLIIEEDIKNIDYIHYRKGDKCLYVFTDKTLVKYNSQTGEREVLVNDYIERVGLTLRIGENKWYGFGKIFEGYKYLNYYEDTYEYQSEKYTKWIKLYIDQNNDCFIERSDSIEARTSKTLIGKDVKVLPFIDAYAYIYNSLSIRRKAFEYIGNDGYMYESLNINKALKMESEDTLLTPRPLARKAAYGKIIKYINLGWHENGIGSLELYESGTLILQIGSVTKEFSYGNLTLGSKGDLVSEVDLISVSPLSKSLSSIDDVVSSILDLYKDYSTSETLTLLLGEAVNTKMIMQDYEKDPAYAMVIDSVHVDPNYYENSLGRDPHSGLSQITTFNYVGLYEHTPRCRDNPVGDDDRFDNYRLWNKDNTKVNVYVHRKPIAKMKTRFMETPTGMTLKLSDGGSYDLDHASKANNGIVAWRWSVKTPDDIAWSTYDSQTLTIDTIDKTLTYHVALQVKDLEGVWSDPVMTLLEPLDQPILLSAKVKSHKDKFSLHRVPITEDYELYAVETQYHQPLTLEIGLYDEDKLVSTIKSLDMIEGTTGHYKDEDKVCFVWHNQLVNVPETLADGPYTIGLKAKAVGQSSKQATCSLAVGVETPINPEPSLDPLWITGESYEITCKTSPYTSGVDLTLYSGTAMEQRIGMTFEKTITETNQGQEAETKKIWRLSYTVPEDIPDGQYKMTFTGRVNTQPEKTATVQEAVHIQTLGIDQVKLTGAWQHWRGQIDMFGEQLLDMPYRFLSWEEIYFVVTTVGHPDSVYVTMSDALEAMSFTDRNGVRYDYIDDMGYEVTFPLQFEKIGKNLWRGTYILPLAASTLSWSNERLHPPYEMVVTAEKNGIKSHYYFNESLGRGIDITGNTTDLIYVQPRPKR